MPSRALPLLRAVAIVVAAGLPAAHAEKADRTKPMTVEADKPGVIDLQKQVVVFNGNVVIAQGTMQIRAERVEVRETPEGYRSATAIGAPGRPASYRQRRDGPGDEVVEARADRIEFDGRNEVLRFIGHAEVRRLRGNTVADEITGATITWDHGAEVFSVAGGTPSAANPGGRVRAVLTPRAADAPAAPAKPPGATQ